MNLTNSVIFDPLLPWIVLVSVTAVMVVVLSFAFWRGLAGWLPRSCAVLILLGALSNPSWQQEEREALSDIVLLVVDSTASQQIGDRKEQTAVALERMKERIEARADTELRAVTLLDGEGDSGSLLMTALSEALADIPSDRLAGVFLLTDGQIHDAGLAPDLPAPLHALLSGHATDWDRRLVVKNAPAFAILGEQLTLTLRVEDQGAVPLGIRQTADLRISIDGQDSQVFEVPVGENLDLPLTLPHGGLNTLQFSTPEMPEELTDRNNAAIVQINGVRDRLRVLLVSGEPHPGERTWRNLLKSDSSVDLVHFTILRPPEKQDGVPVNELSLIAFPTRELFLEKIDEFDLIIFDRYKRRGILPEIYLENVRQYVERGGAVLVAAGPDFASADSLYHSPLAQILPARPTARVIEEGFRPQISLTGQKHPVTERLEAFAPERNGAGQETGPGWGRWFRLIELQPSERGQTVMTGTEDKPLLVLDRVGEGRVALLASDQSWLWTRGYEGGGPQLELLRRLAHWMMKEPELEEEALWAEARGQSMTVVRRTLEDSSADVEITTPGGGVVTVPMTQVAPGRYESEFDGPEIGLYRLTDGAKEAVIALGPAAPREFVETIATGDVLAAAVDETRGGIVNLEEGLPSLRNIRWGRPAAGRGWVGLTPRGAYLTTEVTVHPLLPAWLFVLIAAAFMLGAWLREGRR